MSNDQRSTPPPIAFHEGAHAVMAFHFGTARVVELRLTPNDAQRGGVCVFGSTAPDPRHAVLIELAGHAAEELLSGRPPAQRSGRDDARAFRHALAAAGTVPAARALVLDLRAEAVRILGRSDRWPAVSAIASALHTRGRLDGGEAHRIALVAIRRK